MFQNALDILVVRRFFWYTRRAMILMSFPFCFPLENCSWPVYKATLSAINHNIRPGKSLAHQSSALNWSLGWKVLLSFQNMITVPRLSGWRRWGLVNTGEHWYKCTLSPLQNVSSPSSAYSEQDSLSVSPYHTTGTKPSKPATFSYTKPATVFSYTPLTI